MSTPSTTPRPPRRRSATRAHLISAALVEFESTGSTNVTVETICARAGFTRGAFYSNFDSIDALFFAVYDDLATTVQTQLDAALHTSAMVDAARRTGTFALHQVLDAFPIDQTWLLIRSVAIIQAQHNPQIAAAVQAHGQRFRTTVEPALLEIVTAAGRELTVELAVFADAVIAANVGVMSQSVIYDDVIAVREATIRGVLLGLSTPRDAS